MAARGTSADTGVTILHVSDTQFGQYHRFDDSSDSLSYHLIRDLARLADLGVPPIDLVILSGDIAEKGMRSEYDQALSFVDAMCAHANLGRDRVVVVPGNHDVNWAASEAYFAECRSNETKPQFPYAKKWRHYQRFANELYGPAGFTEEQPYRLHQFDHLRVVVAAMNSTMSESHRPDDHYGSCGREQLRWFEDQLKATTGMLRLGVLHHNARRRAQADDENLRDEDDLTQVLGDHLDLLLHGHTHEGKEDRLPDGTLVLATGSAAVTAAWRPDEEPNQYQVLHVHRDGLTRWARQWAKHKWIADPRVSPNGNEGKSDITFAVPGWETGRGDTDLDANDADTVRQAVDRFEPGPRHQFAADVVQVTRWDLGDKATIELRAKDKPTLDYLIALRPAAPLRCVGIVDGPLDAAILDSLDKRVFAPLRLRGAIETFVVHRGPDEPALRLNALRHGVRVKTWTEYNDLLDPSAYRHWLRTELTADSKIYPQQLYQPQRFRDIDRWGGSTGEVRHDLLTEVYEAILAEESRFVLILGDAGFGKSFLLRRLAFLMLGDEAASVTPIVIYLRDRDKRQTLEEMVASVLIPSRAPFQQDRFRHSLEAGTLALLVDGYDEFAVRVGYANAADQLRTFVQATQGRAKVVLTARPSHFRSIDEVTSKLFASLRTVHHGRVHQLEPFDETQQLAFLTRWFELRGESDSDELARRWMSTLDLVDNLPELAKTPRMLSFIVEDLSIVELNDVARQGTVTAAQLYQRLVDRWLASEAAKADADDKRTVPAKERLALLEELALRLWRAGERDVTEDALQQVAGDMLDLPKYDLTKDAAAQLAGGRTLLNVDAGRWRFAHQSVWEFLLANRLAQLLREGQADQLFGEAELTGLTIRFLRDLAPHEAAAWLSRIADGQA